MNVGCAAILRERDRKNHLGRGVPTVQAAGSSRSTRVNQVIAGRRVGRRAGRRAGCGSSAGRHVGLRVGHCACCGLSCGS